MPLEETTTNGIPPLRSQKTGHPLPRRSTPEKSLTLQNHRLARDASLRAKSTLGQQNEVSNASYRNSSGDSHETAQSDPKNWFDHSNENPTATYDNNNMHIDPPFFQKESDSSNEEPPYPTNYESMAQPGLPTISSSADDYRGVIDDLTVEIQRLRDELKRYKRADTDTLRKDKLFEVKMHGLPSKKKRELEATLEAFASNLNNSSSPSTKKKASDNAYSGFESQSKHASSSSGSNFPPGDSAYASMSSGARSSGTSINRPMLGTTKSSGQKPPTPLREIPEGLYPRHTVMTDKDRKKMVVRRLEQLFTGKIGGHAMLKRPRSLARGAPTSSPRSGDVHMAGQANLDTTGALTPEVSAQDKGSTLNREAVVLPPENQTGGQEREWATGLDSASNFGGEDVMESGDGGNLKGVATSRSPYVAPPEQRPTRPRDLDPDRVQIPTENMDYIKHLGLVPLELLHEQQLAQDVHPDAEGWVYLNLLCSLAQLHIINVTPNFVRSAVSEISTKFQISPDGRKIRWRGGSDGTKFSSDSSGGSSQRSPSTDDTDGSNKQHKRQKTGHATRTGGQSGSSGKHASKSDPQLSLATESFHYKPLFAQLSADGRQSSWNETTVSSFGPADDDTSRWNMNGSGSSNRRKRRRDGAIIYYSGAPFCTDLSGDSGDMSPTTRMMSVGQEKQIPMPPIISPPSPPRRTMSGTFIQDRPLSDRGQFLVQQAGDMDVDYESSVSTDSDDIELNFGWTNEPQFMEYQAFESCGLGGVMPEDHFMVVVSTKRSKQDHPELMLPALSERHYETTDGVVRRVVNGSKKVVDKRQLSGGGPLPIEMEYLSGRIKRLVTAPLPPPAIFFPPFSTDTSLSEDYDETNMSSDQSVWEAFPAQSQRHADEYPDGVDLSSGDEEGDDPDESSGDRDMYDVKPDGASKSLPSRARLLEDQTSSAIAAAGTARQDSKSTVGFAASSDDSPGVTAGDELSDESSDSDSE